MTEVQVDEILRGLRWQRRLTLEQLGDSRLSPHRLMLLEDGVEPTPQEIRRLADKLECAPTLFYLGLGTEHAAQIRQDIAWANEGLAHGRAAEARACFAVVAADPALGSRPDLWRQVELGLALAQEAEGDLLTAVDGLTHLLTTLAPLETPLPAMAFEERDEVEQRIDIALALCRCLREKGELTASIHIGEAALTRELPGGWHDRVVELGATLLASYIERGELTACQALAAHLLTAADQLATPRALRAAAWNGATVAAMAGDGRQAAKLAERALAAHAQLDDDARSSGRLRARLAANLQMANPAAHAQARQMLQKACAELRASAARAVDLAYCQLEMARSDLLAGRPQIAAQRAEELAARHPAAGNLVADAHHLRADALRAQQPELASAALEAAGEAFIKLDAPARAAEAFAGSAYLLEQMGKMDASVHAYQRLLDTAGLGS